MSTPILTVYASTCYIINHSSLTLFLTESELTTLWVDYFFAVYKAALNSGIVDQEVHEFSFHHCFFSKNQKQMLRKANNNLSEAEAVVLLVNFK